MVEHDHVALRNKRFDNDLLRQLDLEDLDDASGWTAMQVDQWIRRRVVAGRPEDQHRHFDNDHVLTVQLTVQRSFEPAALRPHGEGIGFDEVPAVVAKGALDEARE